MKRLIMFVLCVITAFCFFGCVVDGSDESNTGDSTSTGASSGTGKTDDEYVFEERVIKTKGQTYSEGDVVYPDKLWDAPAYEYCPDLDFDSVGNVKGIFYELPVKYKGKTPKIAAYLGFPDNMKQGERVPAVVLVHGGLGTAVPEWVKYWNDLGFAAISMDTEGGEPISGVCNANNLHKEENRYKGDAVYTNGPTNVGFADYAEPLGDQWMYQATSAVISACSLISSFDCVDVQKIGITGVSWGGVITSITVGYDDRFSFAIPVYGALSLTESCSGFRTIYPSEEASDRWDTLNPLKQTNCKMFYVTGIRDFAFSFDAASRCSQAANGFTLFKKIFNHGQKEAAEEENIPFFARYFIGEESEFVEITKNPTKEDPTLKFRFYGDVTIESIRLNYTLDKKTDKDAVWEGKKIKYIDGCTEYVINMPECEHAYVQIKYNNNLEVSSYLF